MLGRALHSVLHNKVIIKACYPPSRCLTRWAFGKPFSSLMIPEIFSQWLTLVASSALIKNCRLKLKKGG